MNLLKILFVVFAAAAIGFAQTLQSSEAEWLRIEITENKISFAVPPAPMVDAEKRDDGQRLRLIAHQNGVEMEYRQMRNRDAKAQFKMLPPNDLTETSEFEVGEHLVRKTVSRPLNKRFFTSFSIAGENVSITLTVRAKNNQAPEISRFLESIRLDGKPLIVQDRNIRLPEKTVSADELKTSEEFINAFARKPGKFRGKVIFKDDSSDSDDDLEPAELSRGAVIVERPRPGFNGPSRDLDSGTFLVRIRFQMLANGDIGDIIVLSRSDKEFTRSCIEAVKKIRFIPALLDGKNVDSFQTTRYMATFTAISPMMIRR